MSWAESVTFWPTKKPSLLRDCGSRSRCAVALCKSPKWENNLHMTHFSSAAFCTKEHPQFLPEQLYIVVAYDLWNFLTESFTKMIALVVIISKCAKLHDVLRE